MRKQKKRQIIVTFTVNISIIFQMEMHTVVTQLAIDSVGWLSPCLSAASLVCSPHLNSWVISTAQSLTSDFINNYRAQQMTYPTPMASQTHYLYNYRAIITIVLQAFQSAFTNQSTTYTRRDNGHLPESDGYTDHARNDLVRRCS